jgi:hypothetical protein
MEEVHPNGGRAERFRRLGAINWRIRSPFIAPPGDPTLPKIPEGAIITSQLPGIRGMSDEMSCPERYYRPVRPQPTGLSRGEKRGPVQPLTQPPWLSAFAGMTVVSLIVRASFG